MNHQQSFVVLEGGRRAPVEGACDDGAVVDDSELLWLSTRRAVAAWFLKVQFSHPAQM